MSSKKLMNSKKAFKLGLFMFGVLFASCIFDSGLDDTQGKLKIANLPLSQQVTNELQNNLYKAFVGNKNAKVALTTGQIDKIISAATDAIGDADLSSSKNLTQIVLTVLEGSQGSLADLSLEDASAKSAVLEVIVNSFMSSLMNRHKYLV